MNFGKVFEHEIVIQPSSNNGFVVRVGCGLFVYNSLRSMLKDLREYLSDPQKFEKEYNESLNLTGDPQIQQSPQNEVDNGESQ